MDPSAIQPQATDAGTSIQLIVLIILVLLSGFFSSAETALTTVNRIRMRALEDEGNRRAATVNKILDRYSKMLSAILIGHHPGSAYQPAGRYRHRDPDHCRADLR